MQGAGSALPSGVRLHPHPKSGAGAGSAALSWVRVCSCWTPTDSQFQSWLCWLLPLFSRVSQGFTLEFQDFRFSQEKKLQSKCFSAALPLKIPKCCRKNKAPYPGKERISSALYSAKNKFIQGKQSPHPTKMQEEDGKEKKAQQTRRNSLFPDSVHRRGEALLLRKKRL